MKIKLSFFIIVLSILSINAQIYTPSATIQGTSGNHFVGIGITPSHLLEVSGSHSDSRILLHSAGAGDDLRQADLMLWASEPQVSWTGVGIGNNILNTQTLGIKLLNPLRGGSYIRLLDNAMQFNIVSSSGTDKQVFAINEQGNIGVGIPTPSFYQHGGNNKVLEIYNPNVSTHSQSHLVLSSGSVNANSYIGSITWALPNANNKSVAYLGVVTAQNSTVSSPSADMVFATKSANNGNWGEHMRISSFGNVGLGTINPDNKLDVNGTIHSKEVKVDMIGWPDYVFKKEYKLPTLEEVEKHIAEKGHLENIPNEQEVLKNGINLGEMNAKLLQKIEEMTLYMIELKKDYEQIKSENKSQNEKILFLENKLAYDKK